MKEVETPKDRKILFYKQFNQESIESLSKSIMDIENHDLQLKDSLKLKYGLDYTPKPIEIYIDSYGGYVYQCLGLLSLIERCKTPIHTIAAGAAMSCGFLLLISGHKRFGFENCCPMLHQISGFNFGKVEDMEENLAEAKRLQSLFEKIIIKKTKITKSEIKNNRERKQDWFFSAKQALEKGVIDEILT